jgi:hypothetical protein
MPMNLTGYLRDPITVSPAIDRLRARFESASPFPWLVIDDFLTPSFVERLLADFPQPGPAYDKYCVGDDGRPGPNYANPDPATFAGSFRELDTLLSSAAWLNWLSTVTGIPNLEYDPDYFGGGIRESRAQVFLPPHIDFNYHPRTLSHRRLNLLIYLNEDWQEEWGGAIQVHRDPRIHRTDNLIASFAPILNRCFLFETSERSWHGFNRLMPPAGRSRRAFTIYYYTKHRPDEASVDFHNTEYVEPALPVRFTDGYTLTGEDVVLLAEAMTRRDDRIAQLYQIRAASEGKYADLWKHYEYYLDLSRKLRAELDERAGESNTAG